MNPTLIDQHTAKMSEYYQPGDFSFYQSKWEAEMLKNAYDAISKEELWNFLRDNSPPEGKGFMFWDAPELKRLMPHMEPIGHSGASYGFTMRAMEYIAKNTWDHFVKRTLIAQDAK